MTPADPDPTIFTAPAASNSRPAERSGVELPEPLRRWSVAELVARATPRRSTPA